MSEPVYFFEILAQNSIHKPIIVSNYATQTFDLYKKAAVTRPCPSYHTCSKHYVLYKFQESTS